jgi:hypothetical protein
MGQAWADEVFELISRCFDRDLTPKKEGRIENITAYHEAGHATIDLYHRIPPDGATIIPNEKELEAGSMSRGWIKSHEIEYYYLDHVEEGDDYDPLLVLLSEALSGMLSSFLYTGNLDIAGLRSDLNFIGDAILSYGIQVLTDEMVNTVTNYTLTVLQKNWEHVETIAKDLIIHKTLDKKYFQNFYKSATFFRIDPIVLG